MRHALALAEKVMFTTTPNPRVGCVIVKDERVIGEGATQPPGGPHAEVVALRDAESRGESVAGATVYVTLEPCNHFGRTPPCVNALLAAMPARVVVAMGDPNPLVNGHGLARLRAAGITVDTGVCLDEALALNVGFVARMHRGSPWVWMKLASSLDGRSALHNGKSQWITGEAARADGHVWRARSCAVLTGIGTVLADDPQMNVRHVATPRQPRKIVVDAQLLLPETARLLDDTPTWIFTARTDAAKAARLADRNVQVIELPDGRGKVDLPAMFRWLGENDINEVHVEAGEKLNGSLLREDCIDELLSYLAPVLLGDAAGVARLPVLESLDDVRRFAFTDVMAVGQDVRLRARVDENWLALREAVSLLG
ncbi:bifunctional diaminohydroxyphosphoribosylaminopyrimidine deaminase/5-amino-6-(5-phosphoribosylamino)uracil reductase RibD [Pigmentiphaga aceris]|uniref:Riboflavin biosynthesis protein RibD n=2 Tax=Pigmentiphaga aceris TaxID=1940612 RepID=A0A5C0B2M4_9BURK|nr:bifunctional diaminohydroxyphosphoribosylaminopyrimidine deaminase/5-amino-6-(5-phosphoribosylamino)uracil reductase RibD [Pigmentiphaga aceris]